MARGEGVKKIADLFETYRRRLRAPERTVVEAVCEVVEDVCGIHLHTKEVGYTPATQTVVLQTKGQVKSEVLLKKDEILVHLKGRLGLRNAPREIL